MKDGRQKTNKMNSKSVAAQPEKEWVTVDWYCEKTGDTRDAVHARRKKGIWLDGVHTCIGPNGRVWVCPEAVYRWVASSAVESGAGVVA